jgi:23S rRNA (cytidine1920-2'-O)/16S rRNA (cytidine1409-2'-O)-methyltransferase
LDIGISTGGFSDCLLQGQAKFILGVEVGHGQLAKKLQDLKNLICLEGINARSLDQNPAFLAAKPVQDFDLCVIDVSFISLSLVLPQAMLFSKKILALVKPQFELGPDELDKNGIVKSPVHYPIIEEKIRKIFLDKNWQVNDYFSSELAGKDGNKEFFVYAVAK